MRLKKLIVGTAVFLTSMSAQAASLDFSWLDFSQDGSEDYYYKVQTSVWTTHFNPKPEHNNHQNLVGFEVYGKRLPDERTQRFHDAFDYARPLVGAAFFRNSFHQNTTYLYAGVRQNLVSNEYIQTYLKVTGGFIHGYRGEYQYKIPFNNLGVAPAIIPMLGAQYKQVSAEMTLFGASGIMLTVGLTF
ncbi:MAG: sn-glycerol-3-phosphate transporter [Gammaproteobacteria bacterium]|nr:sn-glycerol-3-phosphate transporter [Gammaproteobacteria bacterium]